MENQKETVGNYFKANKIVYIAMVTGLVFFALISFLLQLQGFGTIGNNISKLAVYIIPVIALIGLISSTLLFKRKLEECRTKQNLREKLIEYRSALIIKFGIVEGTTFLAVISYLLTGELILLAVAGLLIIVFITYIPTKDKLYNDLDLSYADKQILDNADNKIK